ncbi:MAG: hypothetical protein JXQ87_08420 [Bacteroidia bacterium]
MKQTLFTLCLLLVFGTVRPQNDATVNETVDWINTFGISKTVGHVKDIHSIGVSDDYSEIYFSDYIVWDNGKVRDKDGSYFLDDQYTIIFGPEDSLYQIEIEIVFIHDDSRGFARHDYNFKDKTHA